MIPHYQGPETARSRELYNFSPYRLPGDFLRALLEVKRAALLTNRDLGYIAKDKSDAILLTIEEYMTMSDRDLEEAFFLDPFQGGAGTAANMVVNETLALRTEDRAGIAVSPLGDLNMHQSTNDVIPTALRVMMLRLLSRMEQELVIFQKTLQEKERLWAGILKPGRTQLRDSAVVTLGREASVWASAVSRDRWRVFKAAERLKEVPFGGTAVGTGLGAPRRYVMTAVQNLQRVTGLPVTRGDNLMDATSNYDSVVEAMGIVKTAAVNIKRIASDIRLLSSGPSAGFGELVLPKAVKGSSIMAGKVNPVIAEAAVQISEKVMAGEHLVAALASQSELELNAFSPMITYTVWESMTLMCTLLPKLGNYIADLQPDKERCSGSIESTGALSVALMPLFSYEECEILLSTAAAERRTLKEHLESLGLFTPEETERLFSLENLTSMGYNEGFYRELFELRKEQIESWRGKNGA